MREQYLIRNKFPVYKPPEMCYDFPIWKTRGRREYMCTPHYREIPGGLFGRRSSETERDVQAQMEDGFGEALLNWVECPI